MRRNITAYFVKNHIFPPRDVSPGSVMRLFPARSSSLGRMPKQRRYVLVKYDILSKPEDIAASDTVLPAAIISRADLQRTVFIY